MRVAMLIGGAVLGLLAACGGDVTPRNAADQLVLQLGGGHPSLRAALQVAGVVIAPMHGDIEGPFRQEASPSQGGPEKVRDVPVPVPVPPVPGPVPVPLPAVEPSYREVELPEGETVIHLARRYLGDGRRYREILELNGWSDARSRRLAAGTKVKVPVVSPR